MRAIPFILLVAVLVAPCAQAQIYVCVREDGSRIYSDKKCGANAKVVKGFEKATKKKPTKPESKVTKSVEKKTPEQLAQLLDQCNAGQKPACNEWTFAGGPNALREAEEAAEQACEGGSLAACEQRYCSEGATEQCRQSVLRSSELSGGSWYLRSTDAVARDGSRTYHVRCVFKDNLASKDMDIKCVSNPTQQCSVAGLVKSVAGLRQAASEACRVSAR